MEQNIFQSVMHEILVKVVDMKCCKYANIIFVSSKTCLLLLIFHQRGSLRRHAPKWENLRKNRIALFA